MSHVMGAARPGVGRMRSRAAAQAYSDSASTDPPQPLHGRSDEMGPPKSVDVAPLRGNLSADPRRPRRTRHARGTFLAAMTLREKGVRIMFFIDLLAALFIALLLSAAFVPMVGYRGGNVSEGRGDIAFFLIVIWFVTWAIGIWVMLLGPVVYGVTWLPFLVVGLIAALLLAAAGKASRPRGLSRPGGMHSSGIASHGMDSQSEESAAMLFGAFFWMLMVVLAVAIFVHYGHYRVYWP